MSVQQQMIGSQEVSIEDDVVTCRYHGIVSLPDIIAIHRLLETHLANNPHVYQICDMRDMTGLPSDSRAWIATWSKTHRLSAVVIFGASLLMQVSATMVERLARVLYRTDAPPVRFFRNESDARRWVSEHRTRAM